MDCKKENNMTNCTCTSSSCKRKGICCECVKHHRSNGQLPGCFFPPEAEKTHCRSIEYFIEVMKKK